MISHLLETCSVATLNTIIKEHDWGPFKGRKEQLINFIDTRLEASAEAYYRELPEDDALYLAESLQNEAAFGKSRFRAKYAAELGGNKLKLNVLTELVGSAFEEDNICQEFQAFVKPPPANQVKSIKLLPKKDNKKNLRVYEAGHQAMDECQRVLELVYQGKISVAAKSRRPTPASIKKINAILLSPDFDLVDEDPPDYFDEEDNKALPIRAHAWAVLVQQMKFARLKGSKLELTPKGRKYHSAPELALYKDAVDHFLSDNKFDEFNRITNIKGQSGRAKRAISNVSSRKVEIIEDCFNCELHENPWIEIAELMRQMKQTGYVWDVCAASHTLYFCDSHYGSLYDAGELDYIYLHAFFMESLATLGLVDIAYTAPHEIWPYFRDSWGIDDLFYCSSYDGLAYIRFNEFGNYCLDYSTDYELPAVEVKSFIRILANQDIHVEKTLSVNEVYELEHYAEKVSDYVWKLSAKQIINQLEAGTKMEALINWIEAACDVIPANVKQFLLDIESKSVAVQKIRPALLIELKSEEVAALISSDTQLQKLCRSAGGRFICVLKSKEKSFRSAMKKKGYVLGS